MRSSEPAAFPTLTARVDASSWPRDHRVRLYTVDDVLRLSPPSTVHVGAWSRSYTVADLVLDMCWASFDRTRMLCISMPNALRIVADDGRSFTVPVSAPIRSVWPVLASDGVLLDAGGLLQYLRHPLEAEQHVAVLDPDERIIFFGDGVLVSCGQARAWVWSCTPAERGDDDADGSSLSMQKVASVALSVPVACVFLSSDAGGHPLLCFQSARKAARLDLYSVSLQHLCSIESLDSVAIDGVCCVGGVAHRDLVVLGRDQRLTLWIGPVPCSHVSVDIPGATIASVSHPAGSRFTVTDAAGATYHCDLSATFKSPLTQLCFDALRCTGWMAASGLYALAGCVQRGAMRLAVDFSVFGDVLQRAILHPERAAAPCSASPWELLLSSEFHKNQSMLPSYEFDDDGVGDREPTPPAGLGGSDLDLTAYTTRITDTLHWLYESLKFDSMSAPHLRPLALLVHVLSAHSGRINYVHHYLRDFPDLPHVGLATPSDPSIPPHLLAYLLACLRTNTVPPNFPHGHGFPASPFTNASRICRIYAAFPDSNDECILLRMVECGVRSADLNALPFGVALPLRAVLRACRQSPQPHWPAAAFALIDRPDLCPSSRLCVTDDLASFDGDDTDGTLLVAERARCRFARDHRVLEVRRLLRSSVVLRMSVADWTLVQDQDPAQLYQQQLAALADRVLALSVGRAMFTMASIEPIVTESLPIPPLTLAARTRPHNVLVELDDARLPDDWLCWPAFHNGFASGLRVVPCAAADRALHRSWIVYNRPTEPTHAHAGVLLALGLHGHLGGLARADLYWYLSKKHAPTTMSVVLGLAASERATQSPSVTKTLALHIPALMPCGIAPDADIPVLVQACALVGIGLVYQVALRARLIQSAPLIDSAQGSANRLMTEMLLTEIGHHPTPHCADDREAYALAAGMGLGLVTLGLGDNAIGLADLGLAERLTKLMQGGGVSDRAIYQPIASNVVKEGGGVNLAVTGPGAVLALGLMYLRTGDANIAARLALPSTLTALADVWPDLVALRVACRALVLWDEIIPDLGWVQAQVPDAVRRAQDLVVGDDNRDSDDLDGLDLNQIRLAYCQSVSGACLALGLRFAGTANAAAAAVLTQYVRWICALREQRASVLDRCTLDDGLATVVLALAVVMSGTGHLETFTLLRSLRVLFRPGMPYGLHMALHMAIGFLFLAGGRYAIGNGPGAVATLLLAVWPRWPRFTSDNRYHVQLFRHLYVLGAAHRYLDTRDVDTGRPVLVPVAVRTDSTDGDEVVFSAPCLLPDLDSITSLRIASCRFWQVVVDFKACQIRSSGILLVKRRTGHLPYLQDPLGRLGIVARAFPRNPDTTRDLLRSLSADPVLAAFARHLCADAGSLGTFCRAILYDCLIRDAPDMLSTYLHIYAALVELASRPTTSLPMWQLKIVFEASRARSLLQPEFVRGVRARLKAMFSEFDDYRALLTAWIRGTGHFHGRRRHWLALFITLYDLPSQQRLREFAAEAIPGRTLIPQLAARFPELDPDALSHLDSAVRPLVNVRSNSTS